MPSQPVTNSTPCEAPGLDAGCSTAFVVHAAQRGEDQPERRTVADGNNLFACEMFAKLSDDAHNVVFSPLSISTAMAMVYAGARKETASEIAAVMHFSLDQGKSTRSPGISEQ